jgi:hypothetical protein
MSILSDHSTFYPLKVGDILIVTRVINWGATSNKHAYIGDVFIVLDIEGFENRDYGQYINLIGANNIIPWTPEWDALSRYFRHSS